MTIDVGTGDGRAVLAAAARNPRALAIGMDASASAMAESSRRAAAPARKGGLPNALFIVGAAEAAPAELCGVAAIVTVQFPWGSLLRGLVGGNDRAAAGVAGLVAPRGTLELLLAPSARDGLADIPTEATALVVAVAATFESHGFVIDVARLATDDEIQASQSTWARRLRSRQPPDRGVMLMRLVRTA